jgi:DNA-binding response OmpR family regulator
VSFRARDAVSNLYSNPPAEAHSRRAQPTVKVCAISATDNPAVSTVLVVDDEPIVRDVVVRYLERDGYKTLEAASGDEAQGLLERESLSLIVLDVMLPGISGLELCRWIRLRSEVPIVLLTALGEEADRIMGLELGADDYLTKPFSPRELAVRVRNLMRRTALPAAGTMQTIAFGDVVIDPIAREAHKGGALLRLTLKELDLLLFFVSNPRQVFSREQLMDRVWGYQSSLDTGTVTVHIRRLRMKIEDDASHPRHLETVFGSGYRFTL